MDTFQFICLAKSLKHGGRCIAGLKIDGSGWFRPVSSNSDGTLYDNHYKLANDKAPELFDILEVNCLKENPKPHQPENWIISGNRWKKVGVSSGQQLKDILNPEIQKYSSDPSIFNNQDDKIRWQDIKQEPVKYSLCLIKPKNIKWKIETYEKRKFRAIFNLKNIRYNLGITDLEWKNLLEKLPDGEYTSAEVIESLALDNYDPDKFLFTVSLGEPYPPPHEDTKYCYKLVAAVINVQKVKHTLNLQ